MGRSSVFSLEQIYRKQLVGTWSKIPEVFRYVNSLGQSENLGPAYGYMGGGYNPSAVQSGINRIDYSNDTATASKVSHFTGSPSGWSRNQLQNLFGVANLTHAYWGGGTHGLGSESTSIFRLDLSNDTGNASEVGPLSAVGSEFSAVGNASYGYINGDSKSRVDRIDYSSDSSTTAVKGNLNETRVYPGATGNSSYGWFGGGGRSSVDRVDYSNDTATASARGDFPSSREKLAATGNSSYGYWGGGHYNKSTVDRVDYSNDTATASPKGPLATARDTQGATGDASYGYWAGGNPGPPQSIVQRVDYSNDTATASPKGNMDVAKHALAGASARANGLGTPFSLPTPATRSETYPAGGTNYGYIASGDPTSQGGTQIYRIDFDDDTTTASPKGKLNVPRMSNSEGAVGNSDYGYFAGGWSPGHLSSIDRMDYGNDTSTATPKGNIANPGNNWAAAGNVNYGWITAGESPSTGYMTSINRMDYSNDTGTTVRGNTDNYTRLGTAGNSNYGYWAGGQNPKTSRTVRLDYSNDTTWGTTKGSLNASKYNVEGAGNGNYGYFAGGATGVPSQDPSVVDRLDYSNDTATASPRGNLSGKMSDDAATANGSYGYFAPGPSGQPNKRSIDRVDFSNDTATASPRGNIINDADGRMGICPLENGLPSPVIKTVDKGADGYTTPSLGPAYGYTVGGLSYSLYQRVDYSNDTATASNQAHTATPGTLTSSIGNNSNAFTWVAGGQGQYSSIIERYDYSADTNDSIAKGNLAETRGYMAGAVGNASYGYFMGGTNPSNSETTTVQRVDYSNDTATTTVKGPLTSVRYHNNGGVGNQSYGYIGGNGLVSGSSIDRIDYSNDTATASPKGRLTVQGGTKAATGNASYGYWGGGYPLKSNISRLDYSNDSSNTVDKGPLSAAANQFGAFGDTSYGYWAGGWNPGPNLSTVSRLDFSDDTTTAVAKGPLGTAVREHGGNSSRSNALTGASVFIPRIRWVDSAAEVPASSLAPAFGYFHGGNPGYTKTRIDRLDYSNDTDVCVEKGPLSVGRGYHASASNKDYGYWAGGYVWPAGPHEKSNVDRLDYSNDTPTTSPKGPISYARYYLGGTGNASYAYFGGGVPHGSATSYVDRIDYGNDTATASPKGNLSLLIKKQGVTGNPSFGYYGGGTNGSAYFTTMNRIDYSNDTATATVKGPVSIARQQLTATGNTSFGYFIGGDSPSIPSNNSSWVDRLDYSNDTTAASVKGYLSAGTNDAGATGNPNFGYAGGGDTGPTSTLHRIDYSNDSATALARTTLGSTNYGQRAVSGRENGLLPTAALLAPVQPPFPYPVQLPTPGPSMGYFAGGSPGPNWNAFSGIDRIQFSNDTATASPKGALTASKYAMSGCGTKEYGYIGAGGQQPGPDFSTTDRIDYSNDTATALVRGPLNRAGRSTAAASNTTYGYWAGGMTPYPTPTSKVSRLTFASDTGSQVAKGNLTTVRRRWHATGNQSYGYFAGGSPGGSRIDRIDYSNDTPTAASKGPLSVSRSGHAASGNDSFGYFINGFAPNTTTSVDRLDYSSDTTTASPKGPLTSARAYNTGTGSPDFGYVAGGWTQAGQISYTDRIEYSNDTATASPKGTLNSNPYRNASVSARAYGLP